MGSYICHHIWLKNESASPRYLIGEILDAGGNIVEMEGRLKITTGLVSAGQTPQGGMRFGSVENAILYLKRYFTVRPCHKNKTWNVERIENLMPPHP